MVLDYVELGRAVFQIEANAILELAPKLQEDFAKSIELILSSKGRVVICGMGKSGIIGRKIAATLASTGTPSFFMHPGEAYHGDLGMVTSEDIFIAISNSGETDEVIKLISFLKRNGNYLITLTGNQYSTLAKFGDCHLDVGVSEEACPLQLAPTSSTTAALVMGDALAVTLMQARGFKPENFARFHPGGALGRRLLSNVEDEMITGNLPFVLAASSIVEVLSAMTLSGLGLAIVNSGLALGIITDGDLRRAIQEFGRDLFTFKAEDIVMLNPCCVAVGTRVEDALNLMEDNAISSLLVMQAEQVVGVFKK